MANKNFPGPNINSIIETDPQIIKVNMDAMDWGSRKVMFAKLTGDPASPAGVNVPGPPSAPELVIKHSK